VQAQVARQVDDADAAAPELALDAIAAVDGAARTGRRRARAVGRLPIRGIARCSPVANTSPQANTRTTTVRTAVASVEGTPRTPTFARIAVAAAATAERTA
jgi:hypothetical protein